MRVISGTARGCKLAPVPGIDTRPTTDRVKENVFNVIQMHIADAKVLDLFSGTGQLGIETLSRGAKACDFVEKNKAAFSVLEKNIKTARVENRAKLHRMSAEDFLSGASKNTYDLIFLDPPYGGEILGNALYLIERFDILSTNGIIICESAVEDVFEPCFKMVKTYQYGATLITVLQKQSSEMEETE